MSKIYYSEEHEWLAVDGDVARVGITNYAQDQLGELVFVDLPQVGDEVEKDGDAAVVESVKAASDVFAPADGEITAINDAVGEDSSLVNSAAESDGWLWEMKLSDLSQLDGLMDLDGYNAFIGA
ncbi:MAG: glycine cleavage system protein GcvH [Alphaproteobacteria bacterium]